MEKIDIGDGQVIDVDQHEDCDEYPCQYCIEDLAGEAYDRYKRDKYGEGK